MTGYAVTTRETSGGTLTIEIKSVNSRFLDLQFRINDDLRALEPSLREAIMGRVMRGKVECRVSFGRKTGSTAAQALNATLLATLSELQTEIRRQFMDAPALSVNELLRWPGVIEEPEIAQETLQSDVSVAISATLDAFIESRTREGASLQAMLVSRIDDMEAIVQRIAPLIPQVIAQFQKKATERLQEALGLVVQNANASVAPAVTREER